MENVGHVVIIQNNKVMEKDVDQMNVYLIKYCWLMVNAKLVNLMK